MRKGHLTLSVPVVTDRICWCIFDGGTPEGFRRMLR